MTDQAEAVPGHWPQGDAEIETMIDHGDLERVAPSTAHADLLMSHADEHLAAATLMLDTHPTSAFPLIYDAARKAMKKLLPRLGPF